MRKLLLATTAVLAFTGAASAADLAPAPVEPAPYVAPPGFDWSGFYIGAHVGYGWGEVHDIGDDVDLDGFLGGLQAGYNVQFNQFVLGLETDFSAASIDGDADFPGGQTNKFEIDWLGTTTARVGYAIDNILIYGKGGVAYAHGELDVSTPFGDASDDNWHVGWTLGAGVEYGITQNWTAKLEYNYIDLDTETYFDGAAGAAAPDFNAHLVKVGVNYKF